MFLSDTTGGGGGVVCNEPVVDVEHDEEGGEAGAEGTASPLTQAGPVAEPEA